jgi:hypothetical protein
MLIALRALAALGAMPLGAIPTPVAPLASMMRVLQYLCFVGCPVLLFLYLSILPSEAFENGRFQNRRSCMRCYAGALAICGSSEVTASGIGARRAMLHRDSRALALCHLRPSKVVAFGIRGSACAATPEP